MHKEKLFIILFLISFIIMIWKSKNEGFYRYGYRYEYGYLPFLVNHLYLPPSNCLESIFGKYICYP